MISQKNKFPLRTDFLRFRAKAKRVTSAHLTFYFLPSATPRLSVIVPTKVSKLATARNFLKRLTYNAVWPHAKDKSLDCVVIFKPLLLKKTPNLKAELLAELNGLIGSL